MDGYRHSNAIITTRTVAAALAAAALVVLVTLPQISGSGSFQVFLSSYLNDEGLNSDGNCCSSGRPPPPSLSFDSCNSSLSSSSSLSLSSSLSSSLSLSSSGCRTLFRICLSHFQSASAPVHQDRSPLTCSFGSATTPVLGGNSFKVPEVLGSFVNPVDLPFSFTWPGSFALTIEAWHDNESLLMTPFPDPGNSSSSSSSSIGGGSSLISRLSIQQFLSPSEEWQNVRHSSSSSSSSSNRTTFHFRYRVVCSSNSYGLGCSDTCRPRNDFFGHYACSENGTKVCLEGWTGEYCDSAVCPAGCHKVHGLCVEPNHCKCRLGWEGETCDKCIIYPGCQHGSCREPYSCNCEPGWGGIFCNEDLNFCATHGPCLNGATCTNTGHGSYTCLCSPGSTGTNCEMDTDDCRPQHLSCLNGGLCKVNDVSAVYECHCTSGFHGRRCEVPSLRLPLFSQSSSAQNATCLDKPCQNGGFCSAQPDVGVTANTTDALRRRRYRCLCRPGYRGVNCEDKSDECLTNQPCLNGGRCIHESGSFRCLCPTGYDGNRCQTNRDECAGSPCLNDGACVDEINNFRCVCQPGFIGRLCQESAVNCSQSPCADGATCFDLFNDDFRCACADGYTGQFCSVLIEVCLSGPCRNGTRCVEKGRAAYDCICPEGFNGSNCDVRVSNSSDDHVALVVQVYNYSTVANVTGTQLTLILVKQLAVLIGIGLCVPLLILSSAAACLALKRRRFTRRTRRNDVEQENERNNVRFLNNRDSLLSASTGIDLKPVSSEIGLFLKSGDSSQNRNLLLRVENNDGGEKYFRKSNNLSRNKVVDKNLELDA